MSYNPRFEASKDLSLNKINERLEDFAAAGQEQSRTRFSRSPPSVPSVASTAFEESQPPSPGELLRDRERIELRNSTADEQFAVQKNDELDRILKARDMGLLQQPSPFDWEQAAEANVKYRWMRQGIWDDRWDEQPNKIWKHELEDLSQPTWLLTTTKDTNSETKHRKYSDLEDEYQEIAQFSVDVQTRQWSRPCYQFIHQICEERQWIKLGFNGQDQDQRFDLDTKAYENTRSRWVRDGIWDNDWGVIPGVSWKHERPRKFLPAHPLLRSGDDHKAAKMEKAERPPNWYFMAPIEPLAINFRARSSRLYSLYASDPSYSNISAPSSEVPPPQHEQSIKSQETKKTGSTTFSSVTVEAKPKSAKKGQEERQAKSQARKPTANTKKTKFNGKAPQKQKSHISGLSAVKSKQPERILSKKENSNHWSIQKAETQQSNYATSSRPRRAAASKAREKMTKATRP